MYETKLNAVITNTHLRLLFVTRLPLNNHLGLIVSALYKGRATRRAVGSDHGVLVYRSPWSDRRDGPVGSARVARPQTRHLCMTDVGHRKCTVQRRQVHCAHTGKDINSLRRSSRACAEVTYLSAAGLRTSNFRSAGSERLTNSTQRKPVVSSRKETVESRFLRVIGSASVLRLYKVV